VPAYGPQNDVTLKMPAFEWVHVQLHQQKGMISLSPPTICNSAELGITERLQQECNAVVWDPARGSENITQAEQAKVGVVYAEYGLTESGGVVLFSAPERGRSLSLLPESSIFVLRKSSILPRVAQLAEKLHQKAQAGERMPSCINIISGPSSTADIELIKVVGVHGPVKAVYLIIEDC
ncbi:TPA: lactate utilization protein C, partial [Escherichia coli]